jgi:outer membrane protein OmpA-like peptidoglycan-associated protein
LACHDRQHGPVEPSPAVAAALDETEFDDTDDLMHAIEEGDFAERVDLSDEIEEATVPPAITVVFDHGTAISDDEAIALHEFAARLEQNDRAKLVVVGCSDPSGPEDVNLRISLARAEAVAERLGDEGVRASRFQDVLGFGEDCRFKRRVVHVIPTLRANPPAVERLRADDTTGEKPAASTG